MGADELRQRFEDQELALADVRRNYATLASVNKEDKMQLKQLNERHLRDVAEIGQARLQLEKVELRAAALEVAAKDCERLTEEKASLLQALEDAQLKIARGKNTERDLYTKVSGIRERADTLEAYKQTASVEVAEMRKELRDARQALAEQTARADAAEARNATAEKDLSNLRTHSEKLTSELQAVRAKVPELEAKVKESRDEVVSLEKHRRNAEVALAAALAAKSKADEEREAAEKRVATSTFELQALAGQLVEEQSAKTGLSDQLSSASETMAALSFSEDKLEKAEKQLRAEMHKAKLAEEQAAQKGAEAEAAKDRIAELEKESAARKSGWDRDTETWGAEKAALLEQMETRLAVEVREGANRMQAVTAELTAEYERLSDEHVALEREAKDLRAATHKAEFDKLRAETVLEEVKANMKQDLPGLDLQKALRERAEAVAAADRMASEMQALRLDAEAKAAAEAAVNEMAGKLESSKSDLRHAEERLVAAVRARKELEAKLEEIGGARPVPTDADYERWGEEIKEAIRRVVEKDESEDVIDVLEGAAMVARAALAGRDA